MGDLMMKFLEDSQNLSVTSDELSEISKLAVDQQDWEKRIKQMEEDLEIAKEALRNIQEYLLPEAMLAIGMSEFKMTSGAKITIKEDVYASIRKDMMNSAVKWLDENGLGGIVKDQVAVDFGRGDFNNVQDLLDYCQEQGYNAQEKLSVHPMTLKATVKEQMASGVEFPEEYFSTGHLRKSIIKSK